MSENAVQLLSTLKYNNLEVITELLIQLEQLVGANWHVISIDLASYLF